MFLASLSLVASFRRIVRLLWQKDCQGIAKVNDAFKLLPRELNCQRLYSWNANTVLKLSFNIKNIRNPLQRHYCRGQTILSFEQNLMEDTDEIKRYGSNCIVLWSKDLFWSKDKVITLFFSSNKKIDQNVLGSNHIVPNSNFLKIFET